ncbi:DUF3987 domain-containing protein [Microvirga sp. 3-52]|uniref:DUF3987 domain-containing protein n=1 Tax=Microvirga sp. 3-52 TaxID=2792425 RepID=UPI001ACB7B45|nr:DUF3987 domain-containing protein [Microvirga sp. 3-52]MBO1904030.1 DUF3987 domain-containing protein [Microvirga sp. 3-52]MBS7451641.1 DUF3987 domain-containing protein [Microvirga sp. 3-52]
MNILEAVLDYSRRGLPVFPCDPATKRPYTAHGFKDATCDEAQIRRWWKRWPHAMIGMPTGRTIGAFALDPDRPESPGEPDGEAALRELEKRYGSLPPTHTHLTPGGGRHLLFALPEEVKIGTSSGRLPPGIHVRGEGGYIIMPPSVRRDGRKYELAEPLDLFRFERAPDWLLGEILAAKGHEVDDVVDVSSLIKPPLDGHGGSLDRRWAQARLQNEMHELAETQKGGRNIRLNRAVFNCAQVVPHGLLSESEIEAAAVEACRKNGIVRDKGIASVQRTINSAMAAGKESPYLMEDVAARRVERIPQLTVMKGKAPRLTATDKPDRVNDAEPMLPSTTDAWNAFARPAVPSFPLDALPLTLRAFAEERAVASGADINAYAMAVLTMLAGVVDHRVVLKPKRYHDDLLISPVLWTLIVAPPSARKTAIMRDAHRAIDRLDERDIGAYQVAVAEEEERAKAEERKPEKVPPPRHRILTDATSERLCDLLSHQDSGAILIRDELAGWIGAMDKYGGGGRGAAQDRSIWVRAFDGGPYTQHRLTAGDRRVRNLSVAVIGSIQPERLAEMGRLDTDGLLQRFLPVMMGDAQPYRDDERDIGVERALTALIDRLDLVRPGTFLLSDEGRTHFARFTDDMTKAGRITDPSPAFGSFLAKLPRTLGAIALILHLVDIAEGRCGVTDDVSDQALAAAERIVREFLIPHGAAFYDLQTGGQAHSRARQIATAIIKHKGPIIQLRDLMRATRALKGMTREDALKQLFSFEAGGWLTPVERGPYNTAWHITPNLKERFAAEHEAEVRLQAEIRSRIIGASHG